MDSCVDESVPHELLKQSTPFPSPYALFWLRLSRKKTDGEGINSRGRSSEVAQNVHAHVNPSLLDKDLLREYTAATDAIIVLIYRYRYCKSGLCPIYSKREITNTYKLFTSIKDTTIYLEWYGAFFLVFQSGLEYVKVLCQLSKITQ